ncbi:hypothetical protein Bca101_036961 [Brassica carinata]
MEEYVPYDIPGERERSRSPKNKQIGMKIDNGDVDGLEYLSDELFRNFHDGQASGSGADQTDPTGFNDFTPDFNSFSDFTLNSDNYFIFVKRRTDSCGKTDGSVSGCWRIMARDKLIKCRETGRILGFKKILKFCEKDNKRSEEQEEEEDEIIWVMEEYRLVDKWKHDQVICKIRDLLQHEVTTLLAKHFSFLPKWIRPFSQKDFMPRWDLCVPNLPTDEIISYYLKMCVDVQNDWPTHFLQSEQVYGVVPWMIVDPDQSSVDLQEGPYFFVNRTESSGRTTDGCDGGCWRIMRQDRVITSKGNKVLGFKRLFKFCVKEKKEPVYKFWADEKYKVNEFKVTWVMDEYRLAKKKEQGKTQRRNLDDIKLRKQASSGGAVCRKRGQCSSQAVCRKRQALE